MTITETSTSAFTVNKIFLRAQAAAYQVREWEREREREREGGRERERGRERGREGEGDRERARGSERESEAYPDSGSRCWLDCPRGALRERERGDDNSDFDIHVGGYLPPRAGGCLDDNLSHVT